MTDRTASAPGGFTIEDCRMTYGGYINATYRHNYIMELPDHTIVHGKPKKSSRPLRVACYAGEIDKTGDTRATVEEAVSLAERPDVDVTFVSGEQIAEGALDHADVLLVPGGQREKMWKAARPLIDAFKSGGRRIVASGSEL